MEDPKADLIFGDWCYCGAHLRPHETGWCTVSNDMKVGLGIVGHTEEAVQEAYAKCRRLEFVLYDDKSTWRKP